MSTFPSIEIHYKGWAHNLDNCAWYSVFWFCKALNIWIKMFATNMAGKSDNENTMGMERENEKLWTLEGVWNVPHESMKNAMVLTFVPLKNPSYIQTKLRKAVITSFLLFWAVSTFTTAVSWSTYHRTASFHSGISLPTPTGRWYSFQHAS